MKPILSLKHLVIIFTGLLTFSSCDSFVVGSGKLIKTTCDVSSFNALDVSGAFKVFLSQGESENVFIETDDNILEYVIVEVRGNTLKIGTHGVGLSDITIRAYVQVKNLEDIKVSGAGKLNGETPLKSERLAIRTSGAGKVQLEIRCERLNADASGAGEIILKGNADRIVAEISGAGELDCEKVLCSKFQAQISGAGKAITAAENQIDARISGAGSLNYKGNPKVYSQISGAGSIKQIN